MLSVIIPHSSSAEDTKELCMAELVGLDHEIIMADDWMEGLIRSKGDFVSLLDHDPDLSPGYFCDLIDLFEEKPSFRKLAMVGSAVSNNGKRIYGFHLGHHSLLPSFRMSSQEPYFAQILFIPGSIIRKSALFALAPQLALKNTLEDSVNLSMLFWGDGNRIMLHPATTYVSSQLELDLPYKIIPYANIELILDMWRRELVG